ncbi:unnamed protein product [Gulo gulo]|uniref:Uncharacterized protein n=1 Tax=Gulo gulo TaxID=48420 RepID=A0A9X9LFG5_GULGU|nr:unnamed protein product [Gulo gulo]
MGLPGTHRKYKRPATRPHSFEQPSVKSRRWQCQSHETVTDPRRLRRSDN